METISEEKIGNMENVKDPLQALTELEGEIKILSEEKLNLKMIEEKLVSEISEEIENRRKKREELKKEIEDLRIRCEMLTKVLNSFIEH